MKMETYGFMIALLFVTITTGVFAIKLLNWVWFRPKKMEKKLLEQGFKGNPYRLLYGDFKEMKKLIKKARSQPIHGVSHAIHDRVLPLFHDVVHKYGKNTYAWLGPIPSIIVMDPETIKEVTLKFDFFQKPHSNPFVELLIQGLFNYEGDKWAKHRKIINPAFHQDKLKHMLPSFYTSAMETISKWDAIVSQKGSNEVDVWPYLQALTSDVISRTAFGSNYEQGKKIFELQKEQAELTIKTVQTLYIPGWRFMPTKTNRRMKWISNNVNNSVRNIISGRIKAMEAREACEDDLLSTLLESNLKEIDKHSKKEVGMSIEDVIKECKLFYFAGQETTSSLLVWTMILLSKYEQWQTLAREEVLHHFGTKKPDYDGLHHLKTMNMILYEVLRLYPPAFNISRRATQEIKLGKVTLPTGVLLSLPIIFLHHNTELWGEDALEFKPERFANGISHATKGKVIFFPFGWGPRICIGQNFSLLEAKMTMTLILQRFSFELSPSYTHAPISSITLQPQYGAHLTLHKI